MAADIFYLDELDISAYIRKKFQKKLLLSLNNGELSILPTDTIYGISGNPKNDQVKNKITKIKRRKTFKPFVIIVFDFQFFLKMLDQLLPEWLSLRNLRGLTCIVKVKENFSYLADENRLVAIRFVELNYLKEIDYFPPLLISSSLNYEGEPFLYLEKDILKFIEIHSEISCVLIERNQEKIKNREIIAASSIINFFQYPYRVVRLGNQQEIHELLNQFANDFIVNSKS